MFKLLKKIPKRSFCIQNLFNPALESEYNKKLEKNSAILNILPTSTQFIKVYDEVFKKDKNIVNNHLNTYEVFGIKS